eukprot:6464398-Amphidinium_carterae.1
MTTVLGEDQNCHDVGWWGPRSGLIVLGGTGCCATRERRVISKPAEPRHFCGPRHQATEQNTMS